MGDGDDGQSVVAPTGSHEMVPVLGWTVFISQTNVAVLGTARLSIVARGRANEGGLHVEL